MVKRILVNRDYVFCDKECPKKETCLFNIFHYPQWKDYKKLSIFKVEDINNCKYYSKIEKEDINYDKKIIYKCR